MKKLLLILLCLPMIGFGQVTSKDLKQINNYKYVVIDQIIGDGHFRTVKKITYNELVDAGYNVILSKKVAKTDVVFPEDLTENPNLALYLTVDVLEDFWLGNETVSIYMYDNNRNLIFKSVRKGQVVGKSTSYCLSTLTSFRYKYDPTGKSGDAFLDKNEVKENAINELKKLKELLNLDLITQEEYDKKAKELKQIILN